MFDINGVYVPAHIQAMKPAGHDIFTYDANTGIANWRKFKFNAKDPENSTSDFIRTQDVEEILDDNKGKQYNARGTFTQKDRMGVHAASIPMLVQQKWMIEDGIDLTLLDECPWTQRKVKQKLNSSDYMHLRVASFTL